MFSLVKENHHEHLLHEMYALQQQQQLTDVSFQCLDGQVMGVYFYKARYTVVEEL